jgi:hypothetical protein
VTSFGEKSSSFARSWNGSGQSRDAGESTHPSLFCTELGTSSHYSGVERAKGRSGFRRGLAMRSGFREWSHRGERQRGLMAVLLGQAGRHVGTSSRPRRSPSQPPSADDHRSERGRSGSTKMPRGQRRLAARVTSYGCVTAVQLRSWLDGTDVWPQRAPLNLSNWYRCARATSHQNSIDIAPSGELCGPSRV